MLIIPLNAINPRAIKSAVIAEMKSNTAAADYTGRRIPSRVNEFKWTERSPVRSAQNVNSIKPYEKAAIFITVQRSVVLREGEEFDGCRFSSLFHFDEQMTVR